MNNQEWSEFRAVYSGLWRNAEPLSELESVLWKRLLSPFGFEHIMRELYAWATEGNAFPPLVGQLVKQCNDTDPPLTYEQLAERQQQEEDFRKLMESYSS